MDRQRIGLPQQRLQARRAFDAHAQLGAVRQVGVEEHHAESQRLRPQRRRGADPAQPDDAESLHAGAPQQRVARRNARSPADPCVAARGAAAARGAGRGPGRWRDPPPRSCRSPARCRIMICRSAASLAVQLVVAHAHPADRAQLREAPQVLRRYLVGQDHQSVRRRAVGIRQIGDGIGRLRKDHPHVGPVDAPLDAVVGIEVLGIQHGEAHGGGPSPWSAVGA